MKCKVTIALCSSLMCVVMLVSCGNSSSEIIEAMQAGDATRAQQLYNKANRNTDIEKDIEKAAASILENLIEQYNNDTISEESVEKQFNTYKEMIGLTNTFSEAENELDALKESKNSFEKGLQLQNEGNATDAYKKFSSVIENDTNYPVAQSYMSTIKEQNDEQAKALMVQAEDYFAQQQYYESTSAAEKAYMLSQNSEVYDEFVKKVIDELAINCGFENPQAKRINNMWGRLDWYLECETITGQKLEEMSEDDIIKTFKEFRNAYHYAFDPYGSLSMSFGEATIGDLYCNGKWYDVYIDDMFGKNDRVTVYTPEEQNEKLSANIEAADKLKNMPHTSSGWTTGGPGVSSAGKNSSETSNQEYQNALTKGLKYANQLHMSKKAVYDQLTSSYGEGFPADAAQYAIDNMTGVDWNANALEKAKQYYYNMSMSKSAVYDQLTSEYGEQFTTSEAQYAIDHLN